MFYTGELMKNTILIMSFLLLGMGCQAYAADCGPRPLPEGGCKVGTCVNGQWEQICTPSTTLPCGIKPVAGPGCKIGNCVDGNWEQICNKKSFISCGPQPSPSQGCTVGKCVDGKWEQICQ